MSEDCSCEATTQHFKGTPPGHGPVDDSETVALAVFRDTPYNVLTCRLLPAAFPTNRLFSYDLSLARVSHTDWLTFQMRVVADADNFVGMSCATGSDIRRITYESTSQPAFKGRGVCLADKVVAGDHDGHAALGWGASDAGLSMKQKQRAREAIKQNLADTFGLVVAASSIPWAAASKNDEVGESGDDMAAKPADR